MNLKPHIAFLLLGTIFGLSFLILTPPFQVPDETNHFLRAYQISTGQFTGVKEDHRVGGLIPIKLDSFTRCFRPMQGNMYRITDASYIWELRNIEMEEDKEIFVDFPFTAKYSFISYIPQSISIFLLRQVTSKVFWIYYGAKLMTFTFWLGCIMLAIYIIPFHKWLFVALALLPMSLYVNSSMSGDVVTNAISFLFIAAILRLAFTKVKVTKIEFARLIILIIILASCKVIYAALLLLFLLVPITKFSSRSSYSLHFGVLILVAVVTGLFWSIKMNTLYITYTQYDPNFRDIANVASGVDMAQQFQFLRSNFSHMFKILESNNMKNTFNMMYEGYIGMFGWLETRMPPGLINLSYILIGAIAVIESTPAGISIKWWHRLLFFISFLVIFVMIFIAMFLTWTIVGANYVHIQGRYLIPFGSLLFILLFNQKFNLPKSVPLLVVTLAILNLSFSYSIISDRFYEQSEFTTTEINCDTESIINGVFSTSEPHIFLGNANTISREEARSGKYSVKVDPEHQYSLTFRTYDVDYGDIIHAEVWRKGEDASLVLQSDREHELYIVKSKTDSTDPEGWQRIRITHVFTERVKDEEVAVYIFNHGSNIVYFDDIKIQIQKPIN